MFSLIVPLNNQASCGAYEIAFEALIYPEVIGNSLSMVSNKVD